MKKISFVLVLLSVITVLPVNAERIIQNNNNDRIVYSRSTCPSHELENFDYSAVYRENTYSPEKLKVIGNAIKPELVGKIWYYPAPIEKPANNVKKTVKSGYDLYEISRSGNPTREASDYFTNNSDANKVVPSWVDGY